MCAQRAQSPICSFWEIWLFLFYLETWPTRVWFRGSPKYKNCVEIYAFSPIGSHHPWKHRACFQCLKQYLQRFDNVSNLTDKESSGCGRDDSCDEAESPGDTHEETCVPVVRRVYTESRLQQLSFRAVCFNGKITVPNVILGSPRDIYYAVSTNFETTWPLSQ